MKAPARASCLETASPEGRPVVAAFDGGAILLRGATDRAIRLC